MTNRQLSDNEKYIIALKDIFCRVRRILGDSIATFPISNEFTKSVYKKADLFSQMERNMMTEHSLVGRFADDVVYHIIELLKNPKYASMMAKNTFFFDVLQILHRSSQCVDIDRGITHRFTGINEARPGTIITRIRKQLPQVQSHGKNR